jgi:UDP:flavonoid glycosyltransferase YjiC (YdhE family)
MAKIVFAPYGSLGDLHPFLALALEMRERGHEITICTLEVYREKIDSLGFEFFPLRPAIDPDDRELAREMMDTRHGSEKIIKELMLGNIRPMFDDLMKATEDADILVAGEIVFASHSVSEKRNLKLITTTLAPLSMFSSYEQNIYPNALFLRHLNFLGRPFHKLVFKGMQKVIGGWLDSYKKFRREIGLNEEHNPIIDGKFSELLHLAMFSRALGEPQPDWVSTALQTGFCFYDGQKDLGQMPEDLERFLDEGEPPLVFTLGSAAVMDARDFFEESIKSAKMLNRRAVMLYGVFNEPPKGLDEDRVAFDYAPYSKIFPRAACVIHQAGVGTTAQVLRAGVPALIMPFSHDQPDNAARCERRGIARTIDRDSYNAENATFEIGKLLGELSYHAKAQEVKSIIAGENGTQSACDAIEKVLEK